MGPVHALLDLLADGQGDRFIPQTGIATFGVMQVQPAGRHPLHQKALPWGRRGDA
jgi:hypothetical protein